jgi:hypothetical protein
MGKDVLAMENGLPSTRTVYSFTADGSRAVLLRSTRQRRGVAHRCVWQGTFPPDDEAHRTLDGILVSARAEKALVSSALPVSESICRVLTTPFASVRKALQVFPSLLDIQLPFELTDCCCAFLDTRQQDGQVRTLAVAVRNETLKRHLAECESCSIQPHVVLHEGVVLWRQSLRESKQEVAPQQLRVVVYLGIARTTVACGHGRSLESAAAINAGTETLKSEEQFIAWVRRVLLITQACRESGDEASGWWWCGPGACEGGPVERLQEQLGGMISAEFHTHSNPEFLLERAQAQACFSERADSNLRLGEMTHPDLKRRTKGRERTARNVLLTMALLVCALNAAWMMRISTLQTRADEHIEQLAQRITGGGYVPRGQEVYAVQQVLNEKTQHLKHFRQIHEHPVQQTMQRLIQRAAEREVRLSLLDASVDAVKLEGVAKQWDDAQKLEQALRTAGYATALTRRSVDQDGPVGFSLQGAANEP